MATQSQLSDKLRLVASKGEKGKIKELLQDGARFDIDKYGRTALHYASYYGQAETAKVCIQLGCEINIQDVYGSTALHRAVIDGHVDVVQALIEEGIAVDRQDENGNTALHEAAWNGYSRSVDMLLKFGKSNIHVANKYGLRAIHLSCQNGHNQTTRNLLRGGTHPSIKDAHGDTPLHVASRFGHIACTRVMVSAQADVNAQNKDGNTPLHMAAGLGKQKITRFLTDSGCDVNIRNSNNLTAIDLARKNEHPDVILIIMSAPKRKYQEKENAKRKGKHSQSTGAIGREVSPTRVKKEVRFKHNRTKTEGAENPASPGKKRKELKSTDQPDSILVVPKDKASKKKLKDKKLEEKLLQESGFDKHELKKRVKEQKKIQEEIMMARVMNQPGPSQHIFYTEKQKSTKSSVGCNCTPQLLQIQNKVDANREVMIHEIEHSHNKLDRKIGNLEKKMEHQGECLDKLCKERIHAEQTECLHRLHHRATIERADWEETHVDRMGHVKEELKEWVVNEMQADETACGSSLCKTDDSGYVQTQSTMNSVLEREGALSPFLHDHNQNRTTQHLDNFKYTDKSKGMTSPERRRSYKSAHSNALIVEDVLLKNRTSQNVNKPYSKDYVHIGKNKQTSRNTERPLNQFNEPNKDSKLTSLYVHTGAVPKTRTNSFTKAVWKQDKLDRVKKHQQTVEIEVHKEFIDGEKADKLVMGKSSGTATIPHNEAPAKRPTSPKNTNSYQRSRSLSPKREPEVNNPVIVNSKSELEINKDNVRSRSMSPAYQKVQATSRDRKSRQAARKSDVIMNGSEQIELRAKSVSPSRPLMVNGVSPDSGLELNRNHLIEDRHRPLLEDDQISMSSGIGSAGQSSPQQNVNLKAIPNGYSHVSPRNTETRGHQSFSPMSRTETRGHNSVSPVTNRETNRINNVSQMTNVKRNSAMSPVSSRDTSGHSVVSQINRKDTSSNLPITNTRGNAPLLSKHSDIETYNKDHTINSHTPNGRPPQYNVAPSMGSTTKRLYIDTSQYDLKGKQQINSPISHSKGLLNTNRQIHNSHVIENGPRKTIGDKPTTESSQSVHSATNEPYRREQSPSYRKSSNYSHAVSVPPLKTASIPNHVSTKPPTSERSSAAFHPRIVNTSGQPLVVTNMNGNIYSRNALPTQQAPPRNVSDSENAQMTKSKSFQTDTERNQAGPHSSRKVVKPAQYSSQPDLYAKQQMSTPVLQTSNMQQSRQSDGSSYKRYPQPQQEVLPNHRVPSLNQLDIPQNHSSTLHSPNPSISSSSTTHSGGSGNRRRNPLDVSLMKEFLSSETGSKPEPSGDVAKSQPSKSGSNTNTLNNTINTGRILTSDFGSSTRRPFSTFGY
ncbi:uncharacterized protein [Antedon mediterranea]|uniref:uncharacterized protein n=1 Tax=Antedon mediterranea TaxID=105859 RepID=UPI003AF497DF